MSGMEFALHFVAWAAITWAVFAGLPALVVFLVWTRRRAQVPPTLPAPNPRAVVHIRIADAHLSRENWLRYCAQSKATKCGRVAALPAPDLSASPADVPANPLPPAADVAGLASLTPKRNRP